MWPAGGRWLRRRGATMGVRSLEIVVDFARVITLIWPSHGSTAFSVCYVDQHVSIIHSQGIHRNLRAWIVRGLARLRIPLPSVPWAYQFVPFNNALTQRPATMQANIVHGGNSPIHISDADDLIATGKFPGFAFGRKLGLRSEFDEVGQRKPLTR